MVPVVDLFSGALEVCVRNAHEPFTCRQILNEVSFVDVSVQRISTVLPVEGALAVTPVGIAGVSLPVVLPPPVVEHPAVVVVSPRLADFVIELSQKMVLPEESVYI